MNSRKTDSFAAERELVNGWGPRPAFALLVFLTISAAFGQTPEELRIYEAYRLWVTQQPVAVQRSSEVLETYRSYLTGRGADAADAETEIRVIRTQGDRAEVERWNRILTAEKPTFNVAPNAFLVEMTKGRKPGKALDVGMGQGRNAVWLAQQGWDVTGFDPAERAVAKARETARQLGLSITTEVKGSEEFAFGEARWDLIVLSWVSFREQAQVLSRALRPGGIIVIEGAHRDATKGTSIGGGVVFDTAEVPGLFRDLRVVRYQEPIAVSDFGQRKVRVVQYCAERPAE
ncbi:MAG: class I SAM-dependent methyltransferase [Bryobacteraceae bacterium]